MKVIYTEEFKRDVRKVKDKKIQDRIKKMVKKIKEDPEVGKPLRYDLLGLRSIKIPPFRILYEIREGLII
jgi:addiction module RelE/StbE family toxin